MIASLGIVWGVALLLIGGLATVLILTLRQKGSAGANLMRSSAEVRSLRDTLLFDHADEMVRATTHGHLFIRISAAAWAEDWRQDLIRVEVRSIDLDAMVRSSHWSRTQVVRMAYDLVAYRMTELGPDVEIAHLAYPIDVVVTWEGGSGTARLLIWQSDGWVPAPAGQISATEAERMKLPVGRRWVATSVRELGPICLVQTLDTN